MIDVQPAIIARLQGWSGLTPLIPGGVLDRVLKDEAYPGDPDATPSALDHGTPRPCVYVARANPVGHPTDAWQGYVDLWPVINIFVPRDRVGGLPAIKRQVFTAMMRDDLATEPLNFDGWRFVTELGHVARVRWVEDAAEPLPDPHYPDTWMDWSRYRVTTRAF